jgi:hypothetical protein
LSGKRRYLVALPHSIVDRLLLSVVGHNLISNHSFSLVTATTQVHAQLHEEVHFNRNGCFQRVSWPDRSSCPPTLFTGHSFGPTRHQNTCECTLALFLGVAAVMLPRCHCQGPELWHHDKGDLAAKILSSGCPLCEKVVHNSIVQSFAIFGFVYRYRRLSHSRFHPATPPPPRFSDVLLQLSSSMQRLHLRSPET